MSGAGRRATFLRFVLVNALNTGLYWVLYLALLWCLPYFWANALALVIAVVVAYLANARYAFGVSTSTGTVIRYLLANGTTVLMRMAVVWLLVPVAGLPEQVAPPAAVAITMPVAFLLTRRAMMAGATTGRHPRVHDSAGQATPAHATQRSGWPASPRGPESTGREAAGLAPRRT